MTSIRPAKIADAEAILIIKTRGRKHGYKGLIDEEYLDSMAISPKRIRTFKQWIEKCEIFLVYEEEMMVLGFISGGRTDDEQSPYPYEIGSFFVDSDHWGQGIGQKLFSAFKQQIGNQPCYLRTFAGSRAEKFYREQ
jgi:GNAT superfamily N-acetyltransferase